MTHLSDPPLKKIVCPECQGCGYRESMHGYWATREAYKCAECAGEGVVEVDEEDDRPAFRDELPDCVWRDAETRFAENH